MTLTRHGHHIPGTADDEIGHSVARCGGPRMCSKCQTDVEKFYNETRKLSEVAYSDPSRRYQARAQDVDAAKVTRANVEALAAWCGGHAANEGEGPVILIVPTLVAPQHVEEGDYLVKHQATGAFEGVEAADFEAQYQTSSTGQHGRENFHPRRPDEQLF